MPPSSLEFQGRHGWRVKDVFLPEGSQPKLLTVNKAKQCGLLGFCLGFVHLFICFIVLVFVTGIC